VVYGHFGGRAALPQVSEALMTAVDKSDSGQFSESDIVDPQGWVLLNYLLDARSGLGRFHHFRISNYDLMLALVEACRTRDVDAILALPDVAERVALYRDQAPLFRAQLERCTSHHGAVAVIDLRGEKMIHAGNRFLVYALFPQTAVSVHIFPGLEGLNTVLAVGKSVLNRTAAVNVGELMLEYGGGGHPNAGTCQVDNEDADRIPDDARDRMISMGIKDPGKILDTNDLAPGKKIIFAAAGVTDGALLRGVSFFGTGIRTHSLIMTTETQHVRFVDTVHVEGGPDTVIRF
jgi:hypothetical protein